MKILDRLPFLPEAKSIRFGQRHVPFRRSSLLIWVSIGLSREKDPARLSPVFPAMLDSGNNSEFFFDRHHLVHWAGIQPRQLRTKATININGTRIPLLEADIWVHPNKPGTVERDPDRTPYRLEMPKGIAVGSSDPAQPIFPRVPLLGFSALQGNGLDSWFDSQRRYAHVWTTDWRSRLFRLIS